MKSWKRTVLQVLAGTLLLLGGLFLTHPYWLPFATKPMANKAGIEWESTEVSGWSSYHLTGVRYANDKVTITVDELSVPQLLPLLLQKAGWGKQTQARAGQVHITVKKGDGQKNEKKERRGFSMLDPIRASIMDRMDWIPDGDIESIRLAGKDGSEILILENLRVRGPALSGVLSGISNVPTMGLQLVITEDRYQIRGTTEDSETALAIELDVVPTLEKAQVTGAIYSDAVPLRVKLDFPDNRWSLIGLSIEGTDWPVPRDLSPWTTWRQHSLLADVDFKLVQRDYSAHLHLSGKAGISSESLEPVEADISFTGDRVFLKVNKCRIETVWLTASLSDPISYSFVSRHFLKDGQFEVKADLNKQSALPVKGQIEATAVVHTLDRKEQEVNFSINGEALEVKGFPIPRLAMQGSYEFPLLTFDSVEVALGKESSSTASGRYLLDSKEVSATGTFALSPEWLQPYTGTVEFTEAVEGTIALEGPLSALNHEGDIDQTRIVVDGFHPLSINGSWSGTGGSGIALSASVHTPEGGNAALTAALEPESSGGDWSVRIDEASLNDPVHALVLEQPFLVRINTGTGLRIDAVSPFQLSSDQTRVGGEYLREKDLLTVNVTNLELGALQSWTTQPPMPINIDQLEVTISHLQPFLESSFYLLAHATDEQFDELDVAIRGLTGEGGIQIESIKGSMEGFSFVDGEFSLPVILRPMNNKQRFSPIPEQPIEGTLRVDISEELATKLPPIPYLGSLPRLKARLTAEGTPENPQAGIEISLAQLNPFKEFNPLMEDFPLENLQFKARVTQDQMAIESLEISMREAKMSAQGTLPMETLVRLFTKEAPDWQSLFEQGDLDLSFSKFEARTFAPLLPPYLRPTGTFNGKLAVRGTSGVTGQLRMEDFSLRPTLFSPTIDGIHFILDVDGMRLDLSKAGATIGNSQIAMAGYLDLADWKNPVYVFSATGKRAPLFRTPDLLLHGDIDLKLDGSNPALPATLGGTLLLRDSVMLMDIDPMAARTSGQSLPKPPFFSITASPMADWLLNIDISGEDFLRFRSPYIKALVSIQMDLSGTAANPIWVGDVYSTEGTIEFPGMRMTISRSEIFLTRERQDALQLDMNAIGQVASYVVSMRIDETVDDPHLEFAATPDLNNTQILHLLATGSPERSGLSSVGLYLGRGLFDPGASNSLWDRFSVEIGRDVSESSKDTLDLYYDISDKWRIHGQYDKYDAQNLNLEWEVFSR